MYKLPRVSIKGLVLSIKDYLRTAFSLNTWPLTHIPSQTGFAPIALVVLLLFGVAAGVLLVQNGVNFLPKASVITKFPIPIDSTDSFKCQGSLVKTRLENGCIATCREKQTSTYSQDGTCTLDRPRHCEGVIEGCVNPGDSGNLYVSNTKCGTINASFIGVIGKDFPLVTYDTCNGGTLDCIDNGSTAYCQRPNNTVDPGSKYSDTPDPWDPPEDGVFRIKYNSKCTSDNKRIFVVKQGKMITQSDKGACDLAGRPCDPGLKPVCDTNKLQCEVTVAGFEAKCVAPGTASAAVSTICQNNIYSPPGKTPNNCTDQKRICDPNGSDNGCPKPTKQADCEGVKYFKDYGFVYNSGHGLCELPNGVMINSGKCTQGSNQCTGGKTCKDLPCPNNNTQCYICTGIVAAPAAAPALTPSTANRAAADAPSVGASQCIGFTRDLVCVPAFQVGVFSSSDQLLATEAQAKLAGERYDKTAATLDLIKSKIKSEQAKEAERVARIKLDAAQKAAKACMEQSTAKK